MDDNNRKLLEALLNEIVLDLASPPQIVPIPTREHELVMLRTFVRKDTLRMLNSLAQTYGVRRSKIVRCIINGVGKYLEQQAARNDSDALLGDVRARIGGGQASPGDVPAGEEVHE